MLLIVTRHPSPVTRHPGIESRPHARPLPSRSEVPLPDKADSQTPQSVTFRDLQLSDAVLAALDEIGYESPSPIQAATIPHLLGGSDVVGQAQTGTGKTAAFALPILSRIDLQGPSPAALVLVPTRELAIQVAEAFQRYASRMKGFHVLPVYGGQSYTPQLHSLRRGVHVVVGTPGRIMDHVKRGTLKLDALEHVVLDEADEMLRMGFIDDVEWILKQTPAQRQVALFSATMPSAVRRIAQNHLRNAAEVTIKGKTSTVSNTRQRYWIVSGMHKLDALTRILEAEPFDGMLVFTRTKVSTEELAERLAARGFAAEPLNGDIVQAQRERTVARLKAGQIDIVVATDVAARGLDVERVSHVVNYDVPYDPESYVHRIGRTGRAGRSGEAILFIVPRERNMLRVIERATRQPIEPMQLPTIADVNQQRLARFSARIAEAIASGEGAPFRSLIAQYEQDHNIAALDIAAALASIAQGKKPLLLDSDGAGKRSRAPQVEAGAAHESAAEGGREPSESALPASAVSRFRAEDAGVRPVSKRDHRKERFQRNKAPQREGSFAGDKKTGRAPDAAERMAKRPRAQHEDEGMETYRIEVGEVHGVKPANIVGAIANEAGLEGRHIGRVVIREDHSFVDLPEGMPKDTFRELQKVRVAGQKLQISRALRAQTERLGRDDLRTKKAPAKHRRKGA
jgi:ATP-dependent RNA helicase DeaD